MRPDAGRDYAEYDLETEFLIGAMNPQETRFQFWRMPEKTPGEEAGVAVR